MNFRVFLRKRQVYLAMLTFIFVASTALALHKNQEVKTQIVQVFEKREYQVSPLPVMSEASFFPVVSAQGVIAVDVASAVILYEKNADLPLLPASTTKIVTALVAMDYFPRDMVVKVGEVNVEGQKMGLYRGEEITIENLLYGLLVYSANDAAEVLAQNYPGGRRLFIEAMNLKAEELNLDNTRFENPVGLDGNQQVSTARDLVRVSQIAMTNPYFRQIVGTKEKTVTDVTGKSKHRLVNINELLGQVEGVMGVKTGWTENARENLVTYLERDGHRVMIAVLGSQDRFGETEELINWIFTNYHWEKVASAGSFE